MSATVPTSAPDRPSALPPAIARPPAWPYLLVGVAAVALPLTMRGALAGWLGSGAVAAAFFAGRRHGLRAGLAVAIAVAGAWMIFRPGDVRSLEVFLAALNGWFALRFRDDRALFNLLVNAAALGALAWVLLRA